MFSDVRLIVAASLIGGLLLTGCTAPTSPPLPDATATAQAVADALSSGDLSGLPFAGSAANAVKEYKVVTAGLGGRRPASVAVGDITYETGTETAIVRLDQTYDLGQTWEFPSRVTLQYAGSDGWQVVWDPSIVQPALDGYTRLSVVKRSATRGEIEGADGDAIVYNRTVYNVGIDKAKVTKEQAATSAKALAKLVGVDQDGFVKQVANGGPQQFVIAITLREGQVPAGVSKIPGGLAQETTLPLGPDKTFAVGVLGTAGLATAEDIQKSSGTVQEGDIVGKSGLQASQNTALRGTDGVTVYLAPRAAADVVAPSTPVTPSPTPITERQVLFSIDPVDGTDIKTTLDVTAQTKAEKVLSKQKGVAAMVVLNVKTGAILAAANSPAAGANAYATTGRYAPGSTFKVSTALALLRAGMVTSSKIQCPVTVKVGGTTFKNVTGFSSSHNGTITLQEAVAWSCNTAMVNGSKKLTSKSLGDAAASLGIGVNHDLGFPAFLGSVPTADSDVAKAMESFGQGQVEASPLAMAAEAASVATGHTIVPYLLVDPATGKPIGTGDTSSAKPLTSKEAAALRSMMSAVVQIGTATSLNGYVTGAKSGTAEFTENGKLQTHAWMIAYTSKYAIAAFVYVGTSGATSAGPLIKAYLS